jgi:hypothetical protein
MPRRAAHHAIYTHKDYFSVAAAKDFFWTSVSLAVGT